MDGSGASSRFVGRAAERTLVRHLLRDAQQGRSGVLVLSGVPGSGKTSLLEWTAGTARAAGAEVLWASGSETSVPFAALGRLLAPLPQHVDLAAAGSEPARAVLEALATRARRRPLVVLLDDVQDLGPASSGVLDDVLVALDDAGARQELELLTILTVREPLEPDGLASRARQLRAARSVKLEGFDEDEAAEVLRAAGRRPDRAGVRALVEQTGGLPLLVASEARRRSQAAGRDRAVVDDRITTIADELRMRLEGVDPETVAVLQQAAVFGEPWTTAQLAVVVERTAGDVDARIVDADRANLVSRRGREVRFAHPLVRAELLDRLTGDQRAVIHEAIARRLVDRQGADALDDETQLRVADHLLQAGPRIPRQEVAGHALRAGRIAMSWTAYDQAARFLSVAADVADGAEPAGARRLVEAGKAAYYDYDHDLAETLFTRAIGAARRRDDANAHLTAALLLTRMRGGKRSRPVDRIDVTELTAALAEHPGADVHDVVQAQAALAEALVGTGLGDHAEPVIIAARAAASSVPSDPTIEEALARVEFAAGIRPMIELDLSAARGRFDRSLLHARAAGAPLPVVLARSRRALLELLGGAVGRARDELLDVADAAADGGFWGEAGLAAALAAFAEVLAGRSTSTDLVQQALRHWRRTSNPFSGAILAALVPALTARGASGGDRDEPWSAGTGQPTPSLFVALAAVERNDPGAARRAADGARWRSGPRGLPTLNDLAIAAALVEVGDLLDDESMVRNGVTAAEELLDRGVLVTLSWPAVVTRLLAVGARRSGDLDTARRWLRAAFDLADRERLGHERARCLLESARIAGAGGDRDAAAAAIVEAVRAFDQEGLPAWIARCDDVGRQLHLPPAVGASGVVRERTILTTDVVGSTTSNARLGDLLYLEQLKVHDRILRARLREHAGVEIKHTGDGLNAAFDEPADAVQCALGALADFEAWGRAEPDLALQVRCGLAHGLLVPSGGDLFGLVQSEAARLCAVAGAGELLATAAVVEARPLGTGASSVGHRALRGLPTEVEVFRITADSG